MIPTIFSAFRCTINPIFALALPVLAEAIPADPASHESAGWLLLGLAGLAGAANQIMGLVQKFRVLRQPEPGDVSTDRILALEQRVSELDRRYERRLEEVITKLDVITKTFGQVVADFNYTIGKIDGQIPNR